MLDYAKKFLFERPITFLYIPVFILFTIGLIALFVWQHCCFSSVFGGSNNFFNFNNGGIWGILNILQFIWGLRFLRDACKFIVIQSISVFRELQLTGIGTDHKILPVMDLIKDQSANIGAVLLVDLSWVLSSSYQQLWYNCLFAILKLVALHQALAVIIHAVGLLVYLIL